MKKLLKFERISSSPKVYTVEASPIGCLMCVSVVWLLGSFMVWIVIRLIEAL